jgi:hypothetical protein
MLSLWSAPEITIPTFLDRLARFALALSLSLYAFFDQRSLVKRAKLNCGLAIVFYLIQVNILEILVAVSVTLLLATTSTGHQASGIGMCGTSTVPVPGT